MCVHIRRTRFFRYLISVFPVSVVHTLSQLVFPGPQNDPWGHNIPRSSNPSISMPSFRSFRIPSCSFPSVPQFAVASPVKVASKIHSRSSFVAPQYTHHTHMYAVHLSCRHIFGHVIEQGLGLGLGLLKPSSEPTRIILQEGTFQNPTTHRTPLLCTSVPAISHLDPRHDAVFLRAYPSKEC